MNIFSGRRALVIGGTGGIGRAVALGLAGCGAEVIVTGRDKTGCCGAEPRRRESGEMNVPERGDAAIQQWRAFPLTAGGPDGLPPEQAAEYILSRVPAPDILVCAWGPFQRAALGETEAGTWRRLTENNLIFPGIMVSRVIGGMIERKWGRILLFGGTGTDEIRGYTTTAAYSAAKTALGVVAASAALAAAGRGVTCNVLCPGLTDTEYCGAEEREYNRRHSPGGKALRPGDVARTALAMLEDSALNGKTVRIDRTRGFDKTDKKR